MHRGLQDLANPRNAGLAVAVGRQPVVADAMEARRQHVKQEPTHEFVGVERHGLVARRALVTVVLPAEGDAALVQRDQSAVGDGHPKRVARQVGQHRVVPGERQLGIDDPLALAYRPEPGDEGEVGSSTACCASATTPPVRSDRRRQPCRPTSCLPDCPASVSVGSPGHVPIYRRCTGAQLAAAGV
jgi:hypothetical protein